MSRGKKTSPEVIYQVMTSWCVHHNNMEVSRETGVPEATVRKIVEVNKDKEEFAKLCDEKKAEFNVKASRIIDKALDRLERAIEDDENYIPVNQLSTAIGTLYDKRALSRGESTQNVDFATNLDLNKLMSVAGYKKVEEDND